MSDVRPNSTSAAISTLRSAVRDAVEAAWSRATASGRLPADMGEVTLPTVEVERPANPENGDLSSNLAMQLARPYRMAPLAIATEIADEIRRSAEEHPTATPIASAEVAPPGFINMRVADHALEERVASILAAPDDWGRITPTTPRVVNVEFVSANPTGPLHIGNARGAFVGDLLCRVLASGGQRITREYYFNDSGGQIRNLGASVVALRRGEPVPEDGYKGEYVVDLAAALPDEVWQAATNDDADTVGVIGHWAAGRVREGIEASLDALGVHFDVWTSEARLHDEGWVDRAVERLRERGHVYEEDGAIWFRSTALGDDKDRVIYRSNGEPTYFAADIGYVTEKFSRGFDHLIYIWGADHHGTVARVRNAATAMGYDADAVEMKLYSWVRFVRDGEEVSMSKRAGDFITLDDLLAEVGVDAARWFFASRSTTTAIDFDIERMRRLRESVDARRERRGSRDEQETKGVDLGVYYVQYAHARIAAILRKAAEAGLSPVSSLDGALTGEPEAALARVIVRYPEVVEDAVAAEETQGITAYATELATTFTDFYRDARVVDVEAPARSAARLALARAAQITLANALALLGISAPESM